MSNKSDLSLVSHFSMSIKGDKFNVEDMDQTLTSCEVKHSLNPFETSLSGEESILCMESISFDEENYETVSIESDSSVTFDISGQNKNRQSMNKTEERFKSEVKEAFEDDLNINHLRLSSSRRKDSVSAQFPRILFVGNLYYQIDENVLIGMFEVFGKISRIALYNDMTSTYPYAYIQFDDHESARSARFTCDGMYLFGHQIKVCWVFDLPVADPKLNTNNGIIVFIDCLGTDIEEQDLREAFEPFGQICESSIGTNSTTNRSKGFGFVNFFRKNEAQNAINRMNGQLIQCSLISENGLPLSEIPLEKLDFCLVYCQSSEFNRKVCCAGLQIRLCIQIIIILFSPFGCVKDIRIIEEKGCALISYESKRSAAQAIVDIHEMKIMGQTLSCWWAEECTEDNDNVYYENDSQFNDENSISLSDGVCPQNSTNFSLNSAEF